MAQGFPVGGHYVTAGGLTLWEQFTPAMLKFYNGSIERLCFLSNTKHTKQYSQNVIIHGVINSIVVGQPLKLVTTYIGKQQLVSMVSIDRQFCDSLQSYSLQFDNRDWILIYILNIFLFFIWYGTVMIPNSFCTIHKYMVVKLHYVF